MNRSLTLIGPAPAHREPRAGAGINLAFLAVWLFGVAWLCLFWGAVIYLLT